MKPVDRARLYLDERVFDPIIGHPNGPEKYKNVITASRRWVQGLEKVGDIHGYMVHVIAAGNTTGEELASLAELGFESYESTIGDFENEFAPYLDEKTTFEDFVLGEEYSSWVINGVAKKYDIRSGGILVCGSVPYHSAVLIRANMSGGKYENAWLQGRKRLKYYLKATTRDNKETFSEIRVENRAIIDHPDVPVYVFTRQSTNRSKFVFRGIYGCRDVHIEGDGKKWFDLERKDYDDTRILFASLLADEQNEFAAARSRSAGERKSRLALAPKKPRRILTLTTQYYRNQDVVVEVLDRADGCCEACKEPAPFSRSSDGSPYLEVHHKVRLADGGEDSVENAIALCPNCHREAHYG